jgi:hypothetical protein
MTVCAFDGHLFQACWSLASHHVHKLTIIECCLQDVLNILLVMGEMATFAEHPDSYLNTQSL